MKKMKLEVFDPPMCCSSGLCGPNVNPELVKFSSDLEWLKTQDVDIERYNLSSHPAAFAKQKSVKKALEKEGNECLPLVLVNGAIVSKGVYPSRDELMGFLEIKSDGATSVKENKGKDSENDIVCGPGCNCGKPLGNKKAKAIVCLVVLLAACSILVYKTKSTKQITLSDTKTVFAAPTTNQINEQAIIVPTIDKQDSAVKSVEDKTKIGEYLDSLSLLNKVAINQDAVFVLVPAKQDEIVNKETIDAIASAEQKLKSSKISIGLYTLRFNSLSKNMPISLHN